MLTIEPKSDIHAYALCGANDAPAWAHDALRRMPEDRYQGIRQGIRTIRVAQDNEWQAVPGWVIGFRLRYSAGKLRRLRG